MLTDRPGNGAVTTVVAKKRTMRAVVLTEPGRTQVTGIEIPEPSAGEVRVHGRIANDVDPLASGSTDCSPPAADDRASPCLRIPVAPVGRLTSKSWLWANFGRNVRRCPICIGRSRATTVIVPTNDRQFHCGVHQPDRVDDGQQIYFFRRARPHHLRDNCAQVLRDVAS